jgi:hypothetical protein
MRTPKNKYELKQRPVIAEFLERRHLLSTSLASISGSTATVNFDSQLHAITLIADGTNLTVTDATGNTVNLTGVTAIVVEGQPGQQNLNVNGLIGSSTSLEIQTGHVVLDPSGASDVESIALSALTIDTGATAIIKSPVIDDTNYVLTLNQLTLDPSAGNSNEGTLILNGSNLIVHTSTSTASATFQAVSADVSSGMDNGLWNGPGIRDSLDSIHTLLVSQAGSTTSFDGVSVASTDVLVDHVLIGDANFDGHVDGSDYSLVDNGYLHQLTGWSNGDFNGDGPVDGSDYTLMDNAYNTQPPFSTSISTADFPASSSEMYFLGNYSTGQYEGHNYTDQSGTGELDTEIVGSSATFQAYISPNSVVTMTVDGTTSTFSSTASAFQFVSIFSGLSDSPHHVIIRTALSGELYFDSDNTLQVTGSAPDIESPSFSGPSGHAQYLPVYSAPFSTYAAFDGDPTYYPGFGEVWPAENEPGVGTGSGIRFEAAVTDISYWTNNNSGNLSRFVVYQDGVPIATSTAIPEQQSFWNVQPLVSGLDGQPHQYQIIPIDPGGYVQLQGIILGGGTGLVETTPEPVKPQWMFFGDTNTSGSAGLTTNSTRFSGDIRQDDAWMLTNFEDVGAIIDGHAGGYMDGYAVSHTSEVTSLSPAPAVVFSRWGTDDIIYGVPVSKFQSDYTSYLTALLAGLPSTTILYEEAIFPATANAFSAATRATYDAAIAAAVTAMNNPRVRYVDTTNWFDPSVDTTDGLHINAAGFVKIYNAEIPVVAATSYSVTGPSTGALNRASATFTVTLATGATFNGFQTITISDGGQNGIFTPSVGAAAASSLIVTPIAGTNSFTFTYTPATTGAAQLSFTDGQPGWTDPTALSFVAT